MLPKNLIVFFLSLFFAFIEKCRDTYRERCISTHTHITKAKDSAYAFKQHGEGRITNTRTTSHLRSKVKRNAILSDLLISFFTTHCSRSYKVRKYSKLCTIDTIGLEEEESEKKAKIKIYRNNKRIFFFFQIHKGNTREYTV